MTTAEMREKVRDGLEAMSIGELEKLYRTFDELTDCAALRYNERAEGLRQRIAEMLFHDE